MMRRTASSTTRPQARSLTTPTGPDRLHQCSSRSLEPGSISRPGISTSSDAPPWLTQTVESIDHLSYSGPRNVGSYRALLSAQFAALLEEDSWPSILGI